YVYRARRPFVPEKIKAVLDGTLAGVIRSKGFFWIATRPEAVLDFSLAGVLSDVKPLGTWWASVPEETWPKSEAVRAYLADHWQDPWGDRRQEIVFIGANIDWAGLKAQLDAALLPEGTATSPDTLPTDLNDPFPVWHRGESAA
ncbi:MAG: GTP-binding protein, partial [Pseudomonadota bacterium]